MSSVLPTARELFIATVAVLMALTVTNMIQPAHAGGGGGPTTGVVFIATGENFPDALGAAATAGASLAPVLLVTSNSVPQPTLDELNRLAPDEIIIVGGTAVISGSVFETLDGLAFGPTVTRISGSNRYETAAALSAATFPTTGLYPIALHASGEQFEGITGTDEIVRQLPTFTAPVDGTIIVNSTAGTSEDSTNVRTRCSITDGLSHDDAHLQVWESAGTAGEFSQLAGTRGFDLTAGQSIDIRLICDTTDTSSWISDSALTAIFIADI